MENTARYSQSELRAFKAIRKNFALTGITPKLAAQPCRLNSKILMHFAVLGSAFACISVFIFNGPGTFIEYTQSIYFATAMFGFSAILMVAILKAKNLFEVIDCIDDMLNASKCCHLIACNFTFINFKHGFSFSIEIFSYEIHLFRSQSIWREI